MPGLDVNLMLAPSLPGVGLDPARLNGAMAERFREVYDDIEGRRAKGEIGFFDLPWASDTARRGQEMANSFGQCFENVVVRGIGGSGLGAATLRDALLDPGWNERDEEERDYLPRLYVLDNPDPATVGPLLDRLDLRRTLFNVVSKSGSTAETMALYLVIRERLSALVGEDKVRGHFLFTTDPVQGALRRIADAEGIPTLPVPSNVGGRFSVLSPAGLWPAAMTGVAIDDLLAGAGAMEVRCRTHELAENPAGLLATLLHHAATEGGMPIHVLMPYGDRLCSFALWFQQLWGESLGKAVDRSGVAVHTGHTPMSEVGATDQHSQLQLFMEGPRDKVVIFLAVEDQGEPLAIPALHADTAELGYLGGHTLGELLDVERLATTEALRQAGRPSMTVELERVDAPALGALFMLFQIATVYAGALYGVDPLDQPGVELSKRITHGLLGREGFSAPSIGNADPRWRV